MSHAPHLRRAGGATLLAVAAAAAAMPAHAGLLDGLFGQTEVRFSSAGAALVEGGQVTLQVQLSRPSLLPVSVPLSVGGTASAGADYVALPAVLRFAPFEQRKTLTIRTLDDGSVEGSEQLLLGLGQPSRGVPGMPNQYRLQIDDNDVAALPTLAFASATGSGDEAQTAAVDIVLSRPSTQVVTVGYTRAGSATAGSDYTVTPATPVRFDAGETRKTLSIVPVDDRDVEGAETVVLTLAAPGHATLGGTTTHTHTIVDNDAPPDAAGKWVSGYYVGYARDLYPPDVVDYAALTHLMLGRITPRADGTLNTHFDIDDVEGRAWAHETVTRAHAAGTKVIVMLGGSGAHDEFASAASAAHRARFVQNLVALANEYGFDGFDLDWEPIVVDPANGIDDRTDFRKLAEALRAVAPDKLLTVPIGWINNNFAGEEADPFWGQVAPLFDQLNIMSYGMASGFWGWESWHSSALYGETAGAPSSIAASVRAWREIGGIPAARLGIGIGFYGSCWRYVTAPHQMPQPPPGGLPVNGNDDNDMSYRNIVTLYAPSASARRDLTAMVPYLSATTAAGPQKCNFVSYDDAWSIGEKAQFVKDNGLGGTIVWTINQGYLPNAPAGARDPLMQALKTSFRNP